MGTFRSAAAGASSRREFLVGAAKGGALLAATGGLTSLVDACGNSPSTTATVGTVKKSVKGEQVRLLTWELYADPSFTKAFERKYPCVTSVISRYRADALGRPRGSTKLRSTPRRRRSLWPWPPTRERVARGAGTR